MSGIAGTTCRNLSNNLSLRGAERRSNLLPDEPRYARQAGDCFGAARLAMTTSTHGENTPGHHLCARLNCAGGAPSLADALPSSLAPTWLRIASKSRNSRWTAGPHAWSGPPSTSCTRNTAPARPLLVVLPATVSDRGEPRHPATPATHHRRRHPSRLARSALATSLRSHRPWPHRPGPIALTPSP